MFSFAFLKNARIIKLKLARNIVSRASFKRRRVRDSSITWTVYLLAIFCASLNIAQKLFESHATVSQTVALLSTNEKCTLKGCFFALAESKGFEPLRGFSPCLVSSEVLSTTQPTLRVI